MNKLYLVMLCAALSYGSICADKVDDGTTNIPLTGNDCRLEFTSTKGDRWQVKSAHYISPAAVERALTPVYQGYTMFDVRPLQQRRVSCLMRYRGSIGLVAGLIVGAAGLELFSNLLYESPEID